MKRRLFNLLSLLSLAIFGLAAFAVVEVLALGGYDSTPEQSYLADRQTFLLRGYTCIGIAFHYGLVGTVRDPNWQSENRGWSVAGIRYDHVWVWPIDRHLSPAMVFSGFFVDYRLVLLLSAILPTLRIRRDWRERKRRCREQRGLCPGCGYDLRASSERCPECGESVPVGHVAKVGG